MRFLVESKEQEIFDAVESHFQNYFGGAGYILPNGVIISCFTDDIDEFEASNHANIEDYLNSIGLSNKHGGWSDGSPIMRELGAIRINNEEWENNYIELPNIRPTNSALYSLQEWLDKNQRHYDYIVVTGPNFTNDVKYYYNDYLPEDIIKRIKRYYSSGKLYESKLLEYGHWKPSKTARREFAQKMQDIDDFCRENNISQSRSSDSYYFTINGQKYRVSNHTVDASNRHAYDWLGNKVRDEYHSKGEEDDTIYITAGKTRLIDIYNDLKAGYKLDRRGNRIQG